MDQYIGKLLDNRYELLERIGIGGMAVVYKGRDHRLNRLVAVKILKEELAHDAEFRRRFHDESHAVAMLSHPNIMAVYDVSHTPELDYIVMELLDGITLKQYIQKKGGKLAWREALHFITQIMKALSHAHGRGIIHRDIKPHNVMVLRDGSLKVADFGIARLTSAAQATLTQEALGSVHYISPEQARGSHIDARSDIYSAGVVLYEMITGRLPYEGDSPVAVAIQHINSIPLAPREIDPEIPEALESITMKAMASEVSQRYISADAMLADLEEFRKNPSINFEYTQADLLVSEGDEPTQVLGANTPSNVRTQPAHSPRAEEEPVYHTRRTQRPPQRPPRRQEEYAYESVQGANSRLPIFLAIGAVAIFLIGMGVFLWTSFFNSIGGGGETVYNVPRLQGMTIAQAQAHSDVVAAGFQIVQGDTAVSDLPEGQIVSQDPESGRNASAGATITVTVSDGSGAQGEVQTMPDVTNRDKRIALSELEALGYSEEKGNLEIREEASQITKDYVVSTQPVAHTSLEGVEKVVVVVSTGPKSDPVTVINFVGMTEEEARRTAEETLELVVASIDPVYDDMEEGRICWQSIPNRTEVEKGQTIRFRVSLGPDPATTEPSQTPEHTPEPSTTPEPEPTPTATQQPSQTPSGQPNTIGYSIDLPRDRETVELVVTVDGQEQFRETVQTATLVKVVNLTGSGNLLVNVYFDGEIFSSQYKNFG